MNRKNGKKKFLLIKNERKDKIWETKKKTIAGREKVENLMFSRVFANFANIVVIHYFTTRYGLFCEINQGKAILSYYRLGLTHC